jgi:hypothetical protein
MSENIDCFLPGPGAIFENFGILYGSVFGHDMFSAPLGRPVEAKRSLPGVHPFAPRWIRWHKRS